MPNWKKVIKGVAEAIEASRWRPAGNNGQWRGKEPYGRPSKSKRCKSALAFVNVPILMVLAVRMVPPSVVEDCRRRAIRAG